MTTTFTPTQTFGIAQLLTPEHDGDWHDKPARYVVVGPEIQKFSTFKDARLWVTCRRRAGNFTDAFSMYLSR